MKPFNCIESIGLLVCKQISSNSFKNEIIDKLIRHIMYIDLNECKQMTDVKLLLSHIKTVTIWLCAKKELNTALFKNVINKNCSHIYI